MRKKTETAIKELNEKIEKLEKKLQNQYVINKFLLNHDRKDVVVENHRFDYVALTYVYGNELNFPCIPNFFYEQEVEVETNTSETIVLKIKDIGLSRASKFIKVKKSSGEWLDITDVIIAERKKEEPPTVANPDTPTTSCENCAKKSNCKLQNKVNFSESMPKMIVCDEFTPAETDFKYFTADQVRNMSQKEVKENYRDIMKSMKKW